MWFLKKEKIEGYNAEIGSDDIDWRTNLKDKRWMSIPILPRIADADNYFYLPALGYYVKGELTDIGQYCYYWSSSWSPTNHDRAYCLYIGWTGVWIAGLEAYHGRLVRRFE